MYVALNCDLIVYNIILTILSTISLFLEIPVLHFFRDFVYACVPEKYFPFFPMYLVVCFY